MIQVELGDGRSIEVDTDDPQAASKAAKKFLFRERVAARTEQYRAEVPSAIDEMSGPEKFFAGAGKSVVDLGRGVQQIGAEIGNTLGFVEDETVGELRRKQDLANERDADLNADGAGLAGNIAGTVATTLLPVGLAGAGAKAAGLSRTAKAANAVINPATLKQGAAAGAVFGGVQPVGTDDSRLKNVVTGAAAGTAGNVLVQGAGRVAQPIKKALSASEERAVGILKRAGIRLDAAQKSGSKAAQSLANKLDDSPATQARRQVFREKQQGDFNRAVLKKIGLNSRTANASVMGQAKKKIGAVFNNFAGKYGVKADGALRDNLVDTLTTARQELSEQEFSILKRQAKNLVAKVEEGQGSITGPAFQKIRESLNRLSSRQDVGFFAREMRAQLDDALVRSVPPEQSAKIVKARVQWRRMKQVEDALAGNAEGNISPSRLFQVLSRKNNRFQSIYGQGDQELVELANAGKMILRNKEANSGTAARIAGQLAPSAVAGGAGLALTGDVETAAKLAAAGYVLPRALSGGLNSRVGSELLTKGVSVAPGGSVLSRLLTAPQNSAAVGAPIQHGVRELLTSPQ